MHWHFDDRHPAAAGQRLDRELDEALALAGTGPGEGEALGLLDGLHGPEALAVSVADGDLTALGGIEVHIRRQPLLEPVLLGERLPDLLGAGLDERLTLDPGRPLVGLLRSCLISQLHGCLW